MIMRARKDGNYLIFELEGQLDFETTQQFEETAHDMIRKSATAPRLVFNLEKLKFVGSCGINQFIQVMKDFNSAENKPRFCHLSSEFIKMFRAFQTSRNPFEIHPTETEARLAFDLPPSAKKPGRKKSLVGSA